MKWLWNFLRGRPVGNDPARLHLLFYTRRGCHLCEEAWEQLAAEQGRCRFTVEAVDVDADPELAARYGDRVPVVVVNGKERFWGRINSVLLRRLFEAESCQKPQDGREKQSRDR